MAQTNLPPVVLQPGWYWWHFIRSEQLEAWEAFAVANRATLKLRKSFPGDTTPASVVVFEVVQPMAWTLSGIPSKAPRKGKTDLSDLADSEQVKSSPSLQQLVDEMGGAVNTIGNVGKVLLWGGAAILLFNLWRWTDAPDEEPG
jgi:hypothetical protein